MFRGFSTRNELLILVKVVRETGLMRKVMVREPQQVGVLKSGQTNLKGKIKGCFPELKLYCLAVRWLSLSEAGICSEMSNRHK